MPVSFFPLSSSLSLSLTLFRSHSLFVCTRFLSRRPTGQSQQVAPVKVFLNAATHGSGPQGRPQPLIWQKKQWRPSLLLFILLFFALGGCLSWRPCLVRPLLLSRNPLMDQLSGVICIMQRKATLTPLRTDAFNPGTSHLCPRLHCTSVGDTGAAGGGEAGAGGESGSGCHRWRRKCSSRRAKVALLWLKPPSLTCTCVSVHMSFCIHEVLFAFKPPFYVSTSFKENLWKAVRALSRLDPLTLP